MLDLIDPIKHKAAHSLVSHLTTAANRLPRSQRASIDTRYSHIYGELKGQRAWQTDNYLLSQSKSGDERYSNYSIILALEAYFSILCNLITASAITGKPVEFLKSARKCGNARRNKLLVNVASGQFHADNGLAHYTDLFDLNFIEDGLPESLSDAVEHLFALTELFWSDEVLSEALDPMQLIHDRVFPKNLCHVTGQFYTPPWLCQLLLGDVTVNKDSTIIDPFCGSGAFLISALQKLKDVGVAVEEANARIMGIDLSPSACLAARTNIVLNSIRRGMTDPSKIILNIICADALAPAVTEGNKLANDMFANRDIRVTVDGDLIAINPTMPEEVALTADILKRYSIATERWIFKRPQSVAKHSNKRREVINGRSRKIAEQLAVYNLSKASILATNPPWVGWEYMARPYRDYLTPAWNVYSLFEQRGLEASFLKEDLSTLCVATATDRYLKETGEAALLLRPATMQSDLAARGLRRLTIFQNREHLNLTMIREFEDMKVFGNAATHTAAWLLKKGNQTKFPIPVEKWSRKTKRWQPTQTMALAEVKRNIEPTKPVCSPADPRRQTGRWSISTRSTSKHKNQLLGSNDLQPRIGFFTGGANGAYYMRKVEEGSALTEYENVTERAKRDVPKARVMLEDELMYEVIRGRDISHWSATPQVSVLCPHTRETKMYPILEPDLKKYYPKAYAYLAGLKPLLKTRNGFAGWEKNIHREHFYTLQRLGDYSFAPYKVCWKYIATDFIISVVEPDLSGRARLPNDKVVFIPFEEEETAYFCAGLLSSSPIRYSVVSSMSGRQISASIIQQYKIPRFTRTNKLHQQIARCCLSGHKFMSLGQSEKAIIQHRMIDELVGKLFGLDPTEMDHFISALTGRLKYFPFSTAVEANYQRQNVIDA